MLESYLPAAADPAAVERAVADAIAETGATSPKDMGRVMKAAMARLAGQNVDGKTVNELVRQETRRRREAHDRRDLAAQPFRSRHPDSRRRLDTAARAARRPAPARATLDQPRPRPRPRSGARRALRRRQRDGRVHRRVPRFPTSSRDLFAEGAMSAAFVPTFTRQLTLDGKADAWRLGNNVLNALLLVDRRARRARASSSRGRSSTCTPATSPACPASSSSRSQLTRVMLPFLTLVAVAAAVMGMLNSLHHYFVPALVAGDVQRRDDRLRVRARAADAGARAAADHGDRDRGAGRRRRPGRAAVAGAAARRIPLPRRSSTGAIPGCGGSCC